VDLDEFFYGSDNLEDDIDFILLNPVASSSYSSVAL
jgi:hypothetical protein